MAVCTASVDKSSPFLPPVHHGEKKNSKLFANLTTRRMFGRFMANKERTRENGAHPSGRGTFHRIADVQTEAKRPLVANRENNFLPLLPLNGDRVVLAPEIRNLRAPPSAPRSPATTSRKSLNGESSRLKSCHDDEGQRVQRVESPPRLITVSGQLSSERIRDVIKPIPCKPSSMTGSSSHVRMTSSHDCLPFHSNDEGYNSQNMSSSSAVTATSSSSSSSNASSNFLVEKSGDAESGHQRQLRQLRPRPKSSTVSCSRSQQPEDTPLRNCGRMSEFHVDSCSSHPSVPPPGATTQTRLLHASFQRNMDELLNGKDRELRDMRSRMEINERAMTTAFQTKEREWRKKMEELEGTWLENMRWHREQTFKNEQDLMTEVVDLRRENDQLRERLNAAELEKSAAVTQRDEAQKSVEILRNHLEDAHRQTTQKLNEIVSHRSHVTQTGRLKTALPSQEVLQNQADAEKFKGQVFLTARRRSLGCKLSSSSKSRGEDGSRFDDVTSCDDVMSQMDDLRKQNELDHYLWMCEKSKVIEYQKKLQTSYLEICQKNQALQDEVIRLRRKVEMNSLDCIETESFC